MTTYIRLAMAALILAVALPLFAIPEWEPLFNGKNLDEWVKRGGSGTYTVENGVITGTTGHPQRQNTFLCTKKKYTDFELEFEFKVDPALNSGVQIRSNSSKAYKNGRVNGYQVEIDPSPRAYSAAIYDEGRRGKFLQDLSNNEPARKAFRQNDWNKVQVSAIGNEIKTSINGVKAVDLHDSMTTTGFIALQVHANGSSTPLHVQWRNMRIKDITRSKIAHWTSSSPFGDYKGTWQPGGQQFIAQVTDLGDGRFHAKFLNKFDVREPAVAEADGHRDGTRVKFDSDKISGVLENKKFTGEEKGGSGRRFTLDYIERHSPTLGLKPPAGATVLFDGSSLDNWQQAADASPCKWKLVSGNAMEVVPGTGSIETKQQFKDLDLHLEFRTSFMPYGIGQGRANSGVYLQGTYEVQVLDSYALNGEDNECGGIYKVGAPRVNMAYPPLQWQTYDIHFVAAKWDASGKKTADAHISVKHNGVLIQDNIDIPDATGGAKWKGEPNHPGPLQLQEHTNKIQYRNIWATIPKS